MHWVLWLVNFLTLLWINQSYAWFLCLLYSQFSGLLSRCHAFRRSKQLHVFTSMLSCFCSLQANSPYVSFSGVKSDKVVQVQNEKLTETGLDLLGWVDNYFGSIEMYVVMKNSNRVQITLPEIGNHCVIYCLLIFMQ